MRNYIFPIVLIVAMYVLSFGMFADIAVNGVLLSPGRTMFALSVAGVCLIMATATVAIVALEIRGDREYARSIA